MYDANSIYGSDPTITRPTASATPDHEGRPEPQTVTDAPGETSRNPLVALMVIIAVAVALTQVTFRGTVSLEG